MMSNERKIGKTIAKLKAAKKSNKTEFSIPTYDKGKGTGESYYGYGEDDKKPKYKTEDQRPRKDLLNALDSASKQIEDLQTTSDLKDDVIKTWIKNAKYYESEKEKWKTVAEDITESSFQQSKKDAATISELKKRVQELEKQQATDKEGGEVANVATNPSILEAAFAVACNGMKGIEGAPSIEEAKDEASVLVDEFKELGKQLENREYKTKTIKVSKNGFTSACDIMVEFLTKLKNQRMMKTLQAQIADLKKQRAALDKEYRKEKDKDDATTLTYQCKRVGLQSTITVTNIYMGTHDKIIGRIISLAGKIASAA